MSSPETDLLLDALQPLFRLNPHAAGPLRNELLEKAEAVPKEDFPVIAETASSLLESFLESSWKSTEKTVLQEFSAYLEEACERLQKSGELESDWNSEGRSAHSLALALPQSFSALEWFKLLDSAEVPTRLNNSIDAVVRRNQTTPTVLLPMFEVLLRIDSERGFAWFEQYLARNRGYLDQDVVRDILRSWRTSRPLPEGCLNWLFEWCGNEDLRQQWPAVAEEADVVLRRQLIDRWLPRLRSARSALVQNLARVGKNYGEYSSALRRWQEDAVRELGGTVTAFIKFSRQLPGSDQASSETAREWSQEAVFHELARMENLFTPILLFSDVLLNEPDGSYRFALSLLGFPTSILNKWRHRLLEQTRKMVYQAVLDDIKADRQPIATIRTYSAGDRQLYRYLLSQLDLVSRTFGSLEQRDKVVEELALHFSSLREAHLLPRELTARYRRLMRTLHEDSLRHLLDSEQYSRSEEFVVRRDLLAAATEARRYIQRRRALRTSVEEMLSSRFDFEKGIRQRRLQFARRVLA